VTGENPEPDAFKAVRGPEGWKEASFELPGRTVKCAVVNGLGNARRLIEALKDGSVQYDFVEVMACPGGCAGGGGQPIYQDDKDFSPARTQNLYALDATAPLRFSHENPSIKTLYQDFLGRPGSETAHRLLHTDQKDWKMNTGPVKARETKGVPTLAV
jgi:NADH-quinone oxidoreductase subunit G